MLAEGLGQASDAALAEQETGDLVSFGGFGELSLACPMCGKGVIARIRNSNVYACDVCGYAVKRGVVLRQSREVGWNR